jgi:hypothetical protein
MTKFVPSTNKTYAARLLKKLLTEFVMFLQVEPDIRFNSKDIFANIQINFSIHGQKMSPKKPMKKTQALIINNRIIFSSSMRI